jgi:hypothetical protein
MSKEKLIRLKRCNVFNNGLVNRADGKLCLYSEVEQLLRDETAGANVEHHVNASPDGNESGNYTCITSDKLNLCFTAHDIEQAKKRYEQKPWLKKPVVKKRKRAASKKKA